MNLAHQTIVFDTPVFTEVDGGRIAQLVSFNKETKIFKAVLVDNGDTHYESSKPLDASKVFLKQNSRGPRNGGRQALLYLLDLGVSNIRNLPESYIHPRANSGIKILLNALDDLSQQSVVDTVYIREFGDHFIMDDELAALCTSLICPKGKPVNHIISILEAQGYHVRPMSERFGWDIAVVETPNGLVLFG